MTDPFIPESACAEPVVLPTLDGLKAYKYVIDAASIQALNAAIATGRPLLVKGEPGTGKSSLARAAAALSNRAFVPFTVNSRTEVGELLYSVDLVERLAVAQAQGALGANVAEVKSNLLVQKFVRPGPLWFALDWTAAQGQREMAGLARRTEPEGWTEARGVVVLIDEIDKADPSVPNGLLDALGEKRFEVPRVTTVTAKAGNAQPLVIITSNAERKLPPAFLRRCLVLRLGLPSRRDALIARLEERGRAHHPELGATPKAPVNAADRLLAEDDEGKSILTLAAEMLADDRKALANRPVQQPGIAEYVDLLDAVVAQAGDRAGRLKLLQTVREFTFKKHEAYAHNVPADER